MKTVVRFEHVSKEYRLDVSRRNILRSLSQSVHHLVQRERNHASERQILWALRNISFELAQGESLALVGRNGAGKSTLLKLLAKITRPTAGQISVDGRISALIELGSGFHPDLTGRENVYLNGAILGLKRREIAQRFDEIVAFSEIERFIDTPVKRYSSGMTVRLGFAVASCLEPNILLVDEVLAVGDAAFRQKCMQRIQALLSEGTSIIFVSHNLYMVQAVCTTALYLERGQIKASGKTMDVIEWYERDLHQERAQKFTHLQTDSAPTITEVEITQIQLLDRNGAACSEFNRDQSVEIRVHYLVHNPSEAANAVVRIIRTDGVTCCMMRTTIDGTSLSLQQGQGTFSVVVDPIQLTGGSYFVDARITNAQDAIVLASGWSKWFYVASAARTHEEQSGIFEPNRRWHAYGPAVQVTDNGTLNGSNVDDANQHVPVPVS